MLTFRYHVATLVAVFLALAAGIALGAGVLDEKDDDTTPRLTTDGKSTLADKQAAAIADGFIDSTRGGLIGEALAETTVTVLVLPNTPKAEIEATTSALTEAGAIIVSTLNVGDDLVLAAKKQAIDELGSQLERTTTNVKVAEGANAYERIGTLLGYALGSAVPAGDPLDEQAQSILAGATTGGLLTTSAPPTTRAHLLLVLAGPPSGDAEAARGTAEILPSLLRALDTASGGVVLAGTAGSAEAPGALSGVRADEPTAAVVSTVDNADTAPGAIVTVLALREQAAGGSGQYGVGAGAVAVLPGTTTG